MNQSTNPTIIAGGGFTGLFTALHLSSHNYSRPIILIDPKERFIFQPLLYEFLSGEMDANQVCPRYEELFENSDVTLIQDRVATIDLHQRQVSLASGLNYTYDYLVLALGSVVNYFGIEGAKEHAWPFRTGEDAVALTEHLRNCLQKASQIGDPQERRRLLTVAVMGGGPAGVELAGTLGDLLPQWYAQLNGDPQEIHLVLLEQLPDLLQGDINHQMRDTARQSLQARTIAIDLRFEHTVTKVSPHQVTFKHKDRLDTLPTETLIWTAGITTHPLIKALPIAEEERDRKDRVLVNSTLQLLNFPEVFAGGDCAAEQENILPPLAQVAYQEGSAIAKNLKAISQGEAPSAATDVQLRGSLLKLGLGESAVNLFEQFEVTGKAGHLIREATYLKLLPTPAHNIKATAEWLIEEIL